MHSGGTRDMFGQKNLRIFNRIFSSVGKIQTERAKKYRCFDKNTEHLIKTQKLFKNMDIFYHMFSLLYGQNIQLNLSQP